jgi:hypothetical protein
MVKYFAAIILLFGMTTAGYSQDLWDVARATIDGKQVAIEYGRPLLKGRPLADLMKMLPPDRIWRAGSGPVTILTTETALNIGGKKVPAGNYSLYMHCPVSGNYALVINSELDQPPGSELPKASANRSNRPYPHFIDYTGEIGKKEVARIPLKQIASPKSEVLVYSFEPEGKGAILKISWGEQTWTVEFQPAT